MLLQRINLAPAQAPLRGLRARSRTSPSDRRHRARASAGPRSTNCVWSPQVVPSTSRSMPTVRRRKAGRSTPWAMASGTFPGSVPRSRQSSITRPLEAFEVEQSFRQSAVAPWCSMRERSIDPDGKIQQILLAIEDVTERARLEREHAVAHERIAMLMQELTHRVKNSLQSIASMVMIEARGHKSGEGQAALERVSHRIDALGQLYSN